MVWFALVVTFATGEVLEVAKYTSVKECYHGLGVLTTQINQWYHEYGVDNGIIRINCEEKRDAGSIS